MGVTPLVTSRPAPAHGEHTREVLRELGVPDSEVKPLIATGAAREWHEIGE
jgi:crotonobetainyl-CoA:carnitine CoA-transferase CaiB-like acyl-CoA transferase